MCPNTCEDKKWIECSDFWKKQAQANVNTSEWLLVCCVYGLLFLHNPLCITKAKPAIVLDPGKRELLAHEPLHGLIYKFTQNCVLLEYCYKRQMWRMLPFHNSTPVTVCSHEKTSMAWAFHWCGCLWHNPVRLTLSFRLGSEGGSPFRIDLWRDADALSALLCTMKCDLLLWSPDAAVSLGSRTVLCDCINSPYGL